jgi:hypothetical protein
VWGLYGSTLPERVMDGWGEGNCGGAATIAGAVVVYEQQGQYHLLSDHPMLWVSLFSQAAGVCKHPSLWMRCVTEVRIFEKGGRPRQCITGMLPQVL